MSFTSSDLRGWFHIFTSLPLVHTSNPDFWDNVFDLDSCWFLNLLYVDIFTHHNLRIWTSLDSRISQVHDSRSSRVHDSGSSPVHDSRSSQIRDFRALHVHDSRSPQIHDFKASQVHDPRASQVSTTLKWKADSHEEARFGCHFCTLLENLSHEFRQTRRFEGVRFCLNSPTLAPRGSGLTPTIRFRENFWILVKKVTLRTSEWTRVSWKTRKGHIEEVFLNYPPRPINKELPS
jgi:hypothetical protein